MRFTQEKTKEINKAYGKIEMADPTRRLNHVFQLRVNESVGEKTRILSDTNGTYICNVEDLPDMIHELIMMKEAITQATGIVFEDFDAWKYHEEQ